MHMSSAFPGGRLPDQPGEYVGEYKGMDWMNAPGEGKILRCCFKFGKRVGELEIL